MASDVLLVLCTEYGAPITITNCYVPFPMIFTYIGFIHRLDETGGHPVYQLSPLLKVSSAALWKLTSFMGNHQ